MKINTLLFLITGSILAVSHYLSLELALYWRYLWLDVPMHFIGGVAVVLGLWTLRDLRAPIPCHVFSLWSAVTFVLVVAIIWEVFEWQVQLTVLAGGYIGDTVLDITMGFLGGLLGYFLGRLNYE